jgi:hypothetical protein
VAGILEGLYFHAIMFADLRGQVAGWSMIVYLILIVLLLGSLIAALLVFFPDYYRLNFNSSEASRQVYERVVTSKLIALRFASLFLVLGIGSLFWQCWSIWGANHSYVTNKPVLFQGGKSGA